MPIRWRLAGGSAVLTCVILAAFAVVVGVLTNRQVMRQFNGEVSAAADQLHDDLNHKLKFVTDDKQPVLDCEQANVRLGDYAEVEHAQIRILDQGTLLCAQDEVLRRGARAPFNELFTGAPPIDYGLYTDSGYRVAVRTIRLAPGGFGELTLLYARPTSDVEQTLSRVKLFLIIGVLGGTILALLAGLSNAQRAMRPIAQLTDAAREIERTRDPTRRLPHPEANDEVGELARTLDGMLSSLDAARGETETILERQREFVADASHELRTPLTSVLANLELLAEELEGEQAESAQAALRSTRRMRRLVGDLLLLARADARRAQPVRATNLADVLTDAASELGPVAEDHELSLDAQTAVVDGVRDDLHRLVLNLIENAVGHTPPGTRVRASTFTHAGIATLVVQDDGPGIPPDMERRIFERFVRGGGDGGRGSGLGLAIVRAVAEVHGGTVTLERPQGARGTRFVIRLPAAPIASGDEAPDQKAEPTASVTEVDHTSTTTGSTIGRRRSRS